jgi:hypothetical protein
MLRESTFVRQTTYHPTGGHHTTTIEDTIIRDRWPRGTKTPSPPRVSTRIRSPSPPPPYSSIMRQSRHSHSHHEANARRRRSSGRERTTVERSRSRSRVRFRRVVEPGNSRRNTRRECSRTRNRSRGRRRRSRSRCGDVAAGVPTADATALAVRGVQNLFGASGARGDERQSAERRSRSRSWSRHRESWSRERYFMSGGLGRESGWTHP